jgi:plasmid stabilization system protein ParE
MRYEVVVQPAADAELDAAYRYIWKESPERAARWRARLLAKAESLSQWPERCPVAPENDAFPEEIRQLLFGEYRLLFTILEAKRQVQVVHIRHGKRRRLGEEAGHE